MSLSAPNRASDWAAPRRQLEATSDLALENGSRVGVIGGGPAGSFFSIFLLQMASRVGIDLEVDIFEPRDFSQLGPGGCNMCGGIISESLVQMLAAEGIPLPPTIIERGIDSYVMHTDQGSVRIETPLQEKRIGAVHRGAGPRGAKESKWGSFDGHLLGLATGLGARVVHGKVEGIDWGTGRPAVRASGHEPQTYDLLAVATGVNSPILKSFETLVKGYRPPPTTRTYISEFHLGQEALGRYLGNSMHVFLLNLPRLEFAALIPKGDFATLCILGENVDDALVHSLISSPEFRRCMPPDWAVPASFCHCSPRISLSGAVQPFADRMVFIGDCGVTRLYKDGIGSAYRLAKVAAVTAVFDGISRDDFRRHYWPACRAVLRDNVLGRLIFMVTREIQRRKCHRRGLVRLVSHEQQLQGRTRHMSTVLWDVFTGSAPYREVLVRTLHPGFWGPFLVAIVRSLFTAPPPAPKSP